MVFLFRGFSHSTYNLTIALAFPFFFSYIQNEKKIIINFHSEQTKTNKNTEEKTEKINHNESSIFDSNFSDKKCVHYIGQLIIE